MFKCHEKNIDYSESPYITQLILSHPFGKETTFIDYSVQEGTHNVRKF